MAKQVPPLRIKPLGWVGRSKEELKEFPEAVMRFIGHALFEAQTGDKSDSAKPLHGFGGVGFWKSVMTMMAILTVPYTQRS